MDVEVETARLRLRMFRRGDVDVFARLFADPQVVQYLRPLDPGQVERQLIEFLLHWEERGFGLWAVELKESRELIGRAGLLQHDDWTASPTNVEVGWTFDPRHWGQGYATEAGRASVEFGFTNLGLDNIISITRPDNVASRRVMQKCGLVEGGRTRWRGFPVVWYELDRRRWDALREERPDD